MPRLLTAEEITRQLRDLPDWKPTGEPATEISASFRLSGFGAALDFVVAVGQAAEEMDHHPDIDIRYDQVTLVLSTHSEGGLTQLDVELAHRCSELAHTAGARGL
jgi:4a-hydroxytetrahydrobiopterin dehydratase